MIKDIEKRLSFDEWYKELTDIFDKNNVPMSPDKECWREFYDDGDSPQDAFDEELSCWSE